MAIAGSLPTCEAVLKLYPTKGKMQTLFFLFLFRHLRALFYGKNPDAARTKRSIFGKKSSTLIEGTVSRVGTAPQFPDTGWTSDPSSFPKVSFTTILSHLVSSGKAKE